MSGLSRTPGKRVWVNSPPRVRIPPAPPELKMPAHVQAFFSSEVSRGFHSNILKQAPQKWGPRGQRTTVICERSPPL